MVESTSFKFDQPPRLPTTNLSFLSSFYFSWIQVATILKLEVKFLERTKTPYSLRDTEQSITDDSDNQI